MPVEDGVVDSMLAEEPFLRRLALGLARHTADADDLIQETLLRAYRARSRFEPGTSMRAWLATICQRLFLNNALKAKRRATQVETDAGDVLDLRPDRAQARYGSAATLDEVLEHMDDQARRAFVRLPDAYRAPFVLFALDGLSYQEVADRLRIPVGTVMSRIYRARHRLQSALAGHDPRDDASYWTGISRKLEGRGAFPAGAPASASSPARPLPGSGLYRAGGASAPAARERSEAPADAGNGRELRDGPAPAIRPEMGLGEMLDALNQADPQGLARYLGRLAPRQLELVGLLYEQGVPLERIHEYDGFTPRAAAQVSASLRRRLVAYAQETLR